MAEAREAIQNFLYPRHKLSRELAWTCLKMRNALMNLGPKVVYCNHFPFKRFYKHSCTYHHTLLRNWRIRRQSLRTRLPSRLVAGSAQKKILPEQSRPEVHGAHVTWANPNKRFHMRYEGVLRTKSASLQAHGVCFPDKPTDAERWCNLLLGVHEGYRKMQYARVCARQWISRTPQLILYFLGV